MAKRWQDWMNMIVGLWLLISPFLLLFPPGFDSQAATNSYIVGALLIVVTLLAIARPAAWQEWVVLFLGIWLLVAAFALGSGQRIILWNNLIAGLVVVIGAVSALNWIRVRPRQ